jgi:hypothetical protein
MEQSPTPDELKARAIEAIEKGDRFSAVELLNQYDPQLATDVYFKLQSEFYWKRRDVSLMLAISQAGIQHGLTAAGRAGEADVALALRSKAKALAYNLASFTWPGWDEKGISLDRSDLAAGMDAARLNLRLAEELDKPEKAKANAWWAVGAHFLAVADYDNAGDAFIRAAAHAANAEATLNRAMEAYVNLAKSLAAPEDDAVREKFYGAVAALKQSDGEDAAAFAEQVLGALRVFQSAARAPI